MNNIQWILLAGLVGYNVMLLTDMFSEWVINTAKLVVIFSLITAFMLVS